MLATFLSFAVLATAVLPSQAQLTPINARNPTLVVKDQVDRLRQRLDLVEGGLDPSLYSKDAFVHLFQSQVLLSVKDKEINASKCAYNVVDFINGMVLRKKIALRMFDSWGKIGSGIATGNLKWLGRYYECQKVHTANYSGRYFGVVIGKTNNDAFGLGAATSLLVGICLPDSCSVNQTQDLLSPIAKVIKQPILAFYPEQPTKYTSTDIIAITIAAILGCIVIAATCYDLYLKSLAAKGATYERMSQSSQEISDYTNKGESFGSRLLLSFSVIKNTRALFDTTQKDGNINVLNGLRFISMTWVILGHSFIFGPDYVDNQLDGAEYYVSTWQFQAVGNATYSVDTFFFLSGLLVAYLGMREMKKRSGKISVGMPYLYRYLRLTPAYAFCILISSSLYSKFGDGPMWPTVAESFRKPCAKYWWSNLLYINNLYPAKLGDECFGWGWYLANDTQFFLLSPFLLLLLFKLPLIGNVVLGFGALLSMIATGVISAHYHQQPQSLGIGLLYSYALRSTGNNLTAGYHLASSEATTPHPTTPPPPTKADEFWSDTYAKPWCRMGVYFIGMMTGYILYHARLRIRMGKVVSFIGWVIASATALAIIYGLYGDIKNATALSNGVAAFYNAVSRPLWSVCLAWLVIACCSGYGGPVNRFLSWKVFVPLSRLTYCAYLVHPLVIFWAYGNSEAMLHFSIIMIVLYFLAFVAIAYAVAFVVSVLIEMPMIGVIKAVLGKTPPSKPAVVEIEQQINYSQDHSEA